MVKQHAAAIVSSKMVVFGGDSGRHLLNDTRVVGSFFLCCFDWKSALITMLLSINPMNLLFILIRYSI